MKFHKVTTMSERKSIGISLNDKTLELVDNARGMIPRSRFIEKIVLENMEKSN